MNPKKLTSSLILISLPSIFLGVLLPIYTHELGYTTFQYTIIVSILSFSQIVMKLVLGRASDRYSRRFIFLSALIFFTSAYFVFSVATQLSVLIFARVISGIAGILLSISLVGLISDSNNSFGQQMGYFDSRMHLGGLIGVGICYLVLKNYELVQGWYVLFMICGGASALAYIFTSITPGFSLIKSIASERKYLLSIKQRKIWILNVFLSTVFSMSSVIFIPYMQKAYDAKLEQIAIVFLLPMIAFSFLGPTLGKIGDRRGYRKTITISLVMCSIAAVGLAFSTSLLLFAVISTMFNLFATMQSYAIDAVFIQDTPQEHIGDAYGKFSVSNNLGGMTGAVVGGYLFDAFSFNMPYLGLAVMILLFSPFMLRLISKSTLL